MSNVIIPTFGQVFKKVHTKQKLTPMETFISRYMPMDDEERFRKLLQKLLDEALKS